MISDEYAAGFFDGEGSIQLNGSGKRHLTGAGGPNWYTLRLTISNTNWAVLTLFCDRWGGYVGALKRYDSYRKDAWRWTVTGTAALPVLQALTPFLVVKRAEAEIAMAHQERIIAAAFSRGRKLPASELALRQAEHVAITALKRTSGTV